MADGKQGLAPRGPERIYAAFRWSMKGLAWAFRHESSFRLEVYLFVVMAPLALYVGHDTAERAILFGCMLPVMALEIVNSGLEALVDKLWPERHDIAGAVKDMGSAAVFVLMVNVVACWLIVLWPRFHGG